MIIRLKCIMIRITKSSLSQIPTLKFKKSNLKLLPQLSLQFS